MFITNIDLPSTYRDDLNVVFLNESQSLKIDPARFNSPSGLLHPLYSDVTIPLIGSQYDIDSSAFGIELKTLALPTGITRAVLTYIVYDDTNLVLPFYLARSTDETTYYGVFRAYTFAHPDIELAQLPLDHRSDDVQNIIREQLSLIAQNVNYDLVTDPKAIYPEGRNQSTMKGEIRRVG